MAVNKFSKYSSDFPPSVCKNLPSLILSASKANKMDTVDGTDTDKSKWIKLKFLMDPGTPSSPTSEYSRHFAILKDGFSEELVKWVMDFLDIANLMPLKKAC
jgi:hypothetical protein